MAEEQQKMCGKSMRFQTAAHAAVWLQTALAVAGTAFSACADDAVGVMRLSVPSNDAAVVEMPFAPFAAAGPTNFLSGPFTGDGGPQSDVVYIVPCDGSTATNAY